MNFPAKYIDDMIVKEYKKKVSKIFKIVKRDLIALDKKREEGNNEKPYPHRVWLFCVPVLRRGEK